MKTLTYQQSEKEALLDFYRYYLSEFHQVKAKYLKFLLADKDKLKKSLREDSFHYPLDENFEQVMLADMRMNYFHCIETFFEIFFALIPTSNKQIPSNIKILERLSRSQFTANYKKIEDIAAGKNKLNFLDDKVKWNETEISVTHHLFYHGIIKNFDDFLEKAKKSESGIRKGVICLAQDFADRSEYNCFKHGLRVFRNINEIRVLDQEQGEKIVDIDLQNSFTYHLHNQKRKERTIVTKSYDIERMFNMTSFCSNLIINMIYLRRVALDPSSVKENKIPVGVFDNDEIEKCTQYQVPVAELKQKTRNPNRK